MQKRVGGQAKKRKIPESVPESGAVDSQSPAGDNGGNASAELNAESARREEADRAKNIIPNVGNASIDSRKLTDYALNPEHPVGGNKAKVFESALGYNKSNAEEFMQQIYEKLPGGRATLGKLDEFGQRCALPGFVDSKNEEKTERNAGYLVVSQSGGGMLRQGTREGIRRTPANRGMRAHRIVKGLDISEDVCHGMCP